MEFQGNVASTKGGGPAGAGSGRPTGGLASRRWVRLTLVLVLAALSTYVAMEQSPAGLIGGAAEPSTWEWFLSPALRNPDLTVPRLDGGVRDVHPVDGSADVWVVGRAGLVLHSPDDGTHWVQLPHDTVFGAGEVAVELRAVEVLANGTGFMAGGDEAALLLATSDGGASWEPVATPSSAALLTLVADAEGRLVVADAYQRLWASPDAGANWTELVFPTPDLDPKQNQIGPPSPADGGTLRLLRVGATGVLVASASAVFVFDWRGVLLDTRPLPDVFTADAGTWVFADGGALWVAGTQSLGRSGDGGSTWTTVQSGPDWVEPADDSAWVEAAAFTAGGRLGWVLTDEYTLGFSSDSGATWRWSPINVTSEWCSLTADIDSEALWIADWLTGTIWRFTETNSLRVVHGGRAVFPPTLSFDDDGRRGLRLTAMRSFVTDDGGATWTPVPVETMHVSGQLADDRGDTWLTTVDIRNGDPGLHVLGPDREPQSLDLVSLRLGGATAVSVGPTGAPVWIEDLDAGELHVATDGTTFQGSRELGAEASWKLRFRRRCQLARDGRHGFAIAPGDALERTEDGGASWAAVGPALPVGSDRVTCSPDGQLVAVFAESGRALAWSADGGATLTRGAAPGAGIKSLDMSAWRGDELWALDVDGYLWRSSLGGGWRRLEVTMPGSDQPVAIESLHRNADGERAWLGLPGGQVLRSSDGGATWKASEFRMLFAPWWWSSMLVLVVLLLWASRQRVLSGAPTISSVFGTDRPLRPGDPDPLGLTALAAGVARFLANENTTPPLTLAVTGSWGSGKSSLMNLIRGQLASYGFRAVWFNAWHHQTEDDMLAALLQHLRRAIPAWWHPRGMSFRVRLLLRRSRRHWVPLTVLVVVAVALRGHALGWIESLGRALDQGLEGTAPSEGSDDSRSVLERLLYSYLPGLAALLAPLLLISRSLGTFQVHSSWLGKLLHGGLRLGSTEVSIGLRQEVAATLADVTAALGRHRLVLYVDDLDRCQPDKAVQVLEMVNFLTSSAEVIILMGLARRQVLHAVGFEMRDIAVSFQEDTDPPAADARAAAGADVADGGTPSEHTPGAEPVVESAEARELRERRAVRAYANRYLEKLINIEVPVPESTAQGAAELLVASSHPARGEQQRAHWSRRLLAVVRHPTVARAAVVVAAVTWAYLEGRPERVVAPPTVLAVSPSLAPGDATRDEGYEGHTVEAGYPAQTLDDDDDLLSSDSGQLLPAAAPPSHLAQLLGLLAALGVLGGLRLGRPPKPLESDAPAFVTALTSWAPVLRLRLRTPRSLKRFLNMVRFYAMVQQRDGAPDAGGPTHIEDDLLVALGALQHVHPTWLTEDSFWLDCRAFLGERKQLDPEALPVQGTMLHGYRDIRYARPLFQAMTRGVDLARTVDEPG